MACPTCAGSLTPAAFCSLCDRYYLVGPLKLTAAEEQDRAEVRLLRRERALLVELDKARCTVMQGLMGGTVFESSLERVMELGDQIIALHHEALGVELLPGTPCPCILCRPPAAQAGKES